jgi:hypothetical protein
MNKKVAMIAMVMMFGAMVFADNYRTDYRLINTNHRLLDYNTYIIVSIYVNKADSSKAYVAIVHKPDNVGASIEIMDVGPLENVMVWYKQYIAMPASSVDNIIMEDWSTNPEKYTYTEEDNCYARMYN